MKWRRWLPGSLFLHAIGHRLTDKKSSSQIDVYDPAQQVLGHIQESVKRTNAGVRCKDIDAAKFADGRFHEASSGLGIRDITFDGNCTPAQGAACFDDFVGGVCRKCGIGVGVVVYDHVGTVPGEFECNAASDPARTAGNDCPFSFKEHLPNPHSSSVQQASSGGYCSHAVPWRLPPRDRRRPRSLSR